MNAKNERNTVMVKFTEIAEIIRSAKSISFGHLCARAHIAPSTLYGYWRSMKTLFEDLRFERGVFYVIYEKHHRMPDGAEVPLET